MTHAILVIDVQKIYTDPTSPLHCLGHARVMTTDDWLDHEGKAN